jgi:hypothetical protein
LFYLLDGVACGFMNMVLQGNCGISAIIIDPSPCRHSINAANRFGAISR